MTQAKTSRAGQRPKRKKFSLSMTHYIIKNQLVLHLNIFLYIFSVFSLSSVNTQQAMRKIFKNANRFTGFPHLFSHGQSSERGN